MFKLCSDLLKIREVENHSVKLLMVKHCPLEKRGGTTVRALASSQRQHIIQESRIGHGSSVTRIRQRVSPVFRTGAGRPSPASGKIQDPGRPGEGCLRHLLLSQVERFLHRETLRTRGDPGMGAYGTYY